MKRVFHEIEPVYDKESEILILGSFPSIKSRESQFYYGHPQNRFWKIMEELYHVQLDSIEIKKIFLHQNHIALWDVIASCEIENSSDASIKNIQVNDIQKIVNESKIKKIFVNGKKAQEYYERYIYNQTRMPCILLPSTSPANAIYSLDRLLEKWKMILQ